MGETTHDGDTTPEGPCTRAGIVDDVDAVAGPQTQLPREPCWCCTTAASEHNSRGTPEGVVLALYDGGERAQLPRDHAQHADVVDDVDYSVAGPQT